MVADERLSPKRRLVIGAFTLAMAAAGFAAGRTALRPGEGATQPIQFNHQKHVKDAGVECSTCHEYYSTGNHSGLPPLATCEGCHQEALGKSPEEQKLLKLIASKQDVSFKKLFRLPDHAYYSHRRHVIDAGLPCETCHGAIADTTAPPRYPLVRITMATCIQCHAQKRVKTGCTSCHR
jgi:hypothetical protein